MTMPLPLQRRRRSVASAAAALLLRAGTTSAVAVTGEASPLVRIPLENYDQMQFFATIHMGGQPFRVIFDTGSSDVWVPSAECRACAGVHRYRANDSNPKPVDDEGLEVLTVGEDDDNEPFSLQYGSGTVSGKAVRETLRLSESLELLNARVGSVHEQGREIQRFQTEGIVGLAMEPLARVSNPSILQMLHDSSEYKLPVVFSLYVSPFPTASPPSQLLLGGIDTALVGPDAVWHRFPVIEDPSSAAYGFWSLYLEEATMQPTDNNEMPYIVMGGAGTSGSETTAAVAIVDSGTSLILFPTAAYLAVIKVMQLRLGTRLRNHSQRSGGYSCRNCDHSEFPALTFAFRKDSHSPDAVQYFTLQGSDYVLCEHRVCTPQLDEASSDMVVLGDIFLRAYYTVFDYETKQLGFACPHGVCSGGIKPPLASDTSFAQFTDLGVVYLRSSLMVAAAIASLWMVSQLHAWLSMSLAARATTRRLAARRGSPKPHVNRFGEKPKTHHESATMQFSVMKTTACMSDRVGLQALAG